MIDLTEALKKSLEQQKAVGKPAAPKQPPVQAPLVAQGKARRKAAK